VAVEEVARTVDVIDANGGDANLKLSFEGETRQPDR